MLKAFRNFCCVKCSVSLLDFFKKKISDVVRGGLEQNGFLKKKADFLRKNHAFCFESKSKFHEYFLKSTKTCQKINLSLNSQKKS